MNLADCVVFWSRETFLDAFDEQVSLVGRINPFSEVTNSGVAAQRRILETPVDQVIPLGRVIVTPQPEKFIVGAANHDYWENTTIRHKYSILPVDTMGAVGTIEETLTDTQSDLQSYAFPFFVRREIDEDERGDYLSGYEIYFSQVKSYIRGDILKLAAEFYRLQTDSWIDGAGFAVAQAVKLENPLRTFDIASDRTVYDPNTDTYSATTLTDVPCFVEHLRQDYEFVTPSFDQIEVGDLAISTTKVLADLKVNDMIGDYRVLSIRDHGTWMTCQCRNES